jgi:pre-mRNA-processing factor 39
MQGNTESAFSIYQEAIEIAAAEEKLHALPILYIHFSRLKYMVCSLYQALGLNFFL